MEPYAMDSQKLPNVHKIVTNFAEFYNKIVCDSESQSKAGVSNSKHYTGHIEKKN